MRMCDAGVGCGCVMRCAKEGRRRRGGSAHCACAPCMPSTAAELGCRARLPHVPRVRRVRTAWTAQTCGMLWERDPMLWRAPRSGIERILSVKAEAPNEASRIPYARAASRPSLYARRGRRLQQPRRAGGRTGRGGRDGAGAPGFQRPGVARGGARGGGTCPTARRWGRSGRWRRVSSCSGRCGPGAGARSRSRSSSACARPCQT